MSSITQHHRRRNMIFESRRQFEFICTSDYFTTRQLVFQVSELRISCNHTIVNIEIVNLPLRNSVMIIL
jgi:hypothetical protein